MFLQHIFALCLATSVAILTLLEAVLQHFCSSTLCLQQGRGSTLVSLFLQKLLWRHTVTFLSRSSFNIYIFLFSPVTFNCSRRIFHWIQCILKSHKSSLERSCSNVQLILTVHSASFDLCFLTYSYNHAVMLALNHGISCLLAHIFFTSIGMFKILHIVSKRSKSFRQSSSCNCSLVCISFRLFSFT